MTLWSDIAEWRGPVLHHSGTINDHMYVVIHTADGTYEGTIAWQKNPASGNSSHFIVALDGTIAQVNDTANRSGAQIEGNPYSIAVENAGSEKAPLTAAQIEANAKILAKAHLVHGIPLQLTGKVGTRGLGHHSMGAESGVNWGHSQCPGEIIKAQKPAILARAIEIVNAKTGKAAAPPIGDSTVATLYRAPNGGIVLADNGVCVPVVSTAELNGISPAPPLVNLPQALFDRFVAASTAAPAQATLSPDQFADFKAGVVPIVHDAAQSGAQSGAAAALDGATIHRAAS